MPFFLIYFLAKFEAVQGCIGPRTTTRLTPSRGEQRCLEPSPPSHTIAVNNNALLRAAFWHPPPLPPQCHLLVPPPSLSRTSTLGFGISRTDLDVSRPKPTKTSYSVSFLAVLLSMPSVGGRSLRSLISLHPKGNQNTFCGPYELALCIKSGDLCWVNGPFPAGANSDLEIFRSGLMTYLEEFERVEADDGYIGEAPLKVRCPKCITTPLERKDGSSLDATQDCE